MDYRSPFPDWHQAASVRAMPAAGWLAGGEGAWMPEEAGGLLAHPQVRPHAPKVAAGLLLASRTNSVSPNTGGAETLLYAVGAAVIGGTSLFGGKGKMLDAVLGGLVIGVIINGMGLLNQPSSVVFMVTGVVLLIAASVDALSRKRAASTGRV